MTFLHRFAHVGANEQGIVPETLVVFFFYIRRFSKMENMNDFHISEFVCPVY